MEGKKVTFHYKQQNQGFMTSSSISKPFKLQPQITWSSDKLSCLGNFFFLILCFEQLVGLLKPANWLRQHSEKVLLVSCNPIG